MRKGKQESEMKEYEKQQKEKENYWEREEACDERMKAERKKAER